MINAIIVDDEPINISNLESLLSRYCKDVKVVATALNAVEARTQILAQKPDLVFLDIEMPRENGFDLLRSLGHIEFEVVFVTAYDTYGIMAIKFSALDYLLKPINITELKNAVSRVHASVHDKKQKDRLNHLFEILDRKSLDENQRIALPTLKETHLVPIKNIVRCESSNNYTTFFLIDGSEHLISKPLYEFDEYLTPYGFIRCHQSHLVNKTHITSILNEDSGYLILNFSSKKIPISKQRKSMVKAML